MESPSLPNDASSIVGSFPGDSCIAVELLLLLVERWISSELESESIWTLRRCCPNENPLARLLMKTSAAVVVVVGGAACCCWRCSFVVAVFEFAANFPHSTFDCRCLIWVFEVDYDVEVVRGIAVVVGAAVAVE